jgi:hypothetical protein
MSTNIWPISAHSDYSTLRAINVNQSTLIKNFTMITHVSLLRKLQGLVP